MSVTASTAKSKFSKVERVFLVLTAILGAVGLGIALFALQRPAFALGMVSLMLSYFGMAYAIRSARGTDGDEKKAQRAVNVGLFIGFVGMLVTGVSLFVP